MDVENKIVYYYCKPCVFENIIKNNEIWLCDMAKTNDYKEVHYAMDEIISKIKCELQKEPAICDGELKKLNRMIEERCTALVKNHHWLSMCFTKSGDYLAQWRTYGFNGKGFSIGFAVDELEKLLCENNSAFRKIDYNGRKSFAEKCAKDLVNQLIAIIESEKLFEDNGRLNKVFENVIDVWFDKYAVEIGSYKTQSFVYEKERRLSCVEKHENILAEIIKNPGQKTYGVSVGERDVFTYKKHKIDKNLIKCIYIGPRNSATEEEIKLLLALGGFDAAKVKVRKSEASYRS